MKEYLKMLVNNSKHKHEIVNQLIVILKDTEREIENRSIRELPLEKNSISLETNISSNAQNVFVKSLSKICS